MLNLIRCEFLKLRKSMAFKVILVIIFVYGTMMTITNIIQVTPTTPTNGISAFLFALAEQSSIVIIMGAVMAGIFICTDFENRTLQNAIACGHSRMTLLISKAIAYFLSMSLIMIPYPIIIGVSISIHNGFGMSLSFEILLKLLLSMISIIFINIVGLSVCVFLAFMIRKSGAVIGSCIGVLALINVVIGVLSRVSNEIQPVLKYFPSITGLGNSVLTQQANYGVFISAIFISLLYMGIILVITGGIFRRAELK